ncbi:MAG: TIGR00730 family Rossman fold protein [Flammeovirgaceae bacterium]
MQNICVFCGSKKGSSPIYEQSAIEFAQVMVKHGLDLVYGAGRVGIMGIIGNEVLQQGGKAYGYIPSFLKDKEVAHLGLTELVEVETMHQRKALMAEKADAFVALPGGMGTMDELCEIITWAQLRLHNKPIGILNVDGYYDHLIQLIDHMVAQGFVIQKHRELILVSDDAEDLIEQLRNFHVDKELPSDLLNKA